MEEGSSAAGLETAAEIINEDDTTILNNTNNGPPPAPSPLSGGYLLIIIGEPHNDEHKELILQRLAKGFLSWDQDTCHVDLEKELEELSNIQPEGEESRNGERLIQFASESLVTEVLIHPQTSTVTQCIKNLLGSFTRHRHIIHAGYAFSGNGSWSLQDGTFSASDFLKEIQEPESQRVIRAYENNVSVHIHCNPDLEWKQINHKNCQSQLCDLQINPVDKIDSTSDAVANFVKYVSSYVIPTQLEDLLEPTDVVGNIRFSHPTLYVFPGGQGDAALFGINGFNMLLDGGFGRKSCFWDFTRHLDRLDAVMLTRVNNSNINGISSLLKRKKFGQIYPQIGYFFSNVFDRLDNAEIKEEDPLIIDYFVEGQKLHNNLKFLGLKTHYCFRETVMEPINLYHKVGHGKLDMFIISPSKDSREIKEFLSKWSTMDHTLFTNNIKSNKVIPIQNMASICALLVWQPADPLDNITRILFPGSAPQHKIFEGLEKLKHLEFLKSPTCTGQSLAESAMITKKQKIVEKISDLKPSAKLGSDIKKSDIKKSEEKVLAQSKLKTKSEKPIERTVHKPVSSEKIVSPTEKKQEPKPKPKTNMSQIKTAHKISPTSTPAKSTKEANNRRVVESKIKEKQEAKQSTKLRKEPETAKRSKSPVKSLRMDSQKSPKKASTLLKGSETKPKKPLLKANEKDKNIKKQVQSQIHNTSLPKKINVKAVPTVDIEKKVESPDKIENKIENEIIQVDIPEIRDTNNEKEVAAVDDDTCKVEGSFDTNFEPRSIGDSLLDDGTEEELERNIVDSDRASEAEFDLKETENDAVSEELEQKHILDEAESEKERKKKDLEEMEQSAEIISPSKEQIEHEVIEIITNAQNVIADKNEVKDTIDKEEQVPLAGASIQLENAENGAAKIISKEVIVEENTQTKSQPDEKVSAMETSATTAPSLPEDEKVPPEELKEVVEEKHVIEVTKESEAPKDVQKLIESEKIQKLDTEIQIKHSFTAHRDLVKTPDEVADLPMHEVVDATPFEYDAKSKNDFKFEEQNIPISKRKRSEADVPKVEEIEKAENDPESNEQKLGGADNVEIPVQNPELEIEAEESPEIPKVEAHITSKVVSDGSNLQLKEEDVATSDRESDKTDAKKEIENILVDSTIVLAISDSVLSCNKPNEGAVEDDTGYDTKQILTAQDIETTVDKTVSSLQTESVNKKELTEDDGTAITVKEHLETSNIELDVAQELVQEKEDNQSSMNKNVVSDEEVVQSEPICDKNDIHEPKELSSTSEQLVDHCSDASEAGSVVDQQENVLTPKDFSTESEVHPTVELLAENPEKALELNNLDTYAIGQTNLQETVDCHLNAINNTIVSVLETVQSEATTKTDMELGDATPSPIDIEMAKKQMSIELSNVSEVADEAKTCGELEDTLPRELEIQEGSHKDMVDDAETDSVNIIKTLLNADTTSVTTSILNAAVDTIDSDEPEEKKHFSQPESILSEDIVPLTAASPGADDVQDIEEIVPKKVNEIESPKKDKTSPLPVEENITFSKENVKSMSSLPVKESLVTDSDVDEQVLSKQSLLETTLEKDIPIQPITASLTASSPEPTEDSTNTERISPLKESSLTSSKQENVEVEEQIAILQKNVLDDLETEILQIETTSKPSITSVPTEVVEVCGEPILTPPGSCSPESQEMNLELAKDTIIISRTTPSPELKEMVKDTVKVEDTLVRDQSPTHANDEVEVQGQTSLLRHSPSTQSIDDLIIEEQIVVSKTVSSTQAQLNAVEDACSKPEKSSSPVLELIEPVKDEDSSTRGHSPTHVEDEVELHEQTTCPRHSPSTQSIDDLSIEEQIVASKTVTSTQAQFNVLEEACSKPEKSSSPVLELMEPVKDEDTSTKDHSPTHVQDEVEVHEETSLPRHSPSTQSIYDLIIEEQIVASKTVTSTQEQFNVKEEASCSKPEKSSSPVLDPMEPVKDEDTSTKDHSPTHVQDEVEVHEETSLPRHSPSTQSIDDLIIEEQIVASKTVTSTHEQFNPEEENCSKPQESSSPVLELMETVKLEDTSERDQSPTQEYDEVEVHEQTRYSPVTQSISPVLELNNFDTQDSDILSTRLQTPAQDDESLKHQETEDKKVKTDVKEQEVLLEKSLPISKSEEQAEERNEFVETPKHDSDAEIETSLLQEKCISPCRDREEKITASSLTEEKKENIIEQEAISALEDKPSRNPVYEDTDDKEEPLCLSKGDSTDVQKELTTDIDKEVLIKSDNSHSLKDVETKQSEILLLVQSPSVEPEDDEQVDEPEPNSRLVETVQNEMVVTKADTSSIEPTADTIQEPEKRYSFEETTNVLSSQIISGATNDIQLTESLTAAIDNIGHEADSKSSESHTETANHIPDESIKTQEIKDPEIPAKIDIDESKSSEISPGHSMLNLNEISTHHSPSNVIEEASVINTDDLSRKHSTPDVRDEQIVVESNLLDQISDKINVIGSNETVEDTEEEKMHTTVPECMDGPEITDKNNSSTSETASVTVNDQNNDSTFVITTSEIKQSSTQKTPEATKPKVSISSEVSEIFYHEDSPNAHEAQDVKVETSHMQHEHESDTAESPEVTIDKVELDEVETIVAEETILVKLETKQETSSTSANEFVEEAVKTVPYFEKDIMAESKMDIKTTESDISGDFDNRHETSLPSGKVEPTINEPENSKELSDDQKHDISQPEDSNTDTFAKKELSSVSFSEVNIESEAGALPVDESIVTITDSNSRLSDHRQERLIEVTDIIDTEESNINTLKEHIKELESDDIGNEKSVIEPNVEIVNICDNVSNVENVNVVEIKTESVIVEQSSELKKHIEKDILFDTPTLECSSPNDKEEHVSTTETEESHATEDVSTTSVVETGPFTRISKHSELETETHTSIKQDIINAATAVRDLMGKTITQIVAVTEEDSETDEEYVRISSPIPKEGSLEKDKIRLDQEICDKSKESQETDITNNVKEEKSSSSDQEKTQNIGKSTIASVGSQSLASNLVDIVQHSLDLCTEVINSKTSKSSTSDEIQTEMNLDDNITDKSAATLDTGDNTKDSKSSNTTHAEQKYLDKIVTKDTAPDFTTETEANLKTVDLIEEKSEVKVEVSSAIHKPKDTVTASYLEIIEQLQGEQNDNAPGVKTDVLSYVKEEIVFRTDVAGTDLPTSSNLVPHATLEDNDVVDKQDHTKIKCESDDESLVCVGIPERAAEPVMMTSIYGNLPETSEVSEMLQSSLLGSSKEFNIPTTESSDVSKTVESVTVIEPFPSHVTTQLSSAGSITVGKFTNDKRDSAASKGGELSSSESNVTHPLRDWDKPLGLPSPLPPASVPDSNKGTPKKQRKVQSNKINDLKNGDINKTKTLQAPMYFDLTYVPHHGNSGYVNTEFFKKIRARYYVFSGLNPSKEVYDSLLEAKETWEDKDLEVTIIPTYDTDTLGYWVTENEDLLSQNKIDLSPSASRCTINLQDHETSCSAYRLEF